MRKIIYTALALFSILSISSCRKEFIEPTIPPMEGLLINLDTLPDFSSSVMQEADPEFYAYYSDFLSKWTSLYDDVIDIPIQAYKAILGEKPSYQARWSFAKKNCGIGGSNLDVTLSAEEFPKHYEWNLYVGSYDSDAYDSFAWISGESDREMTSGSWTINVSPEDREPVVTSQWLISEGKLDYCTMTFSHHHKLNDKLDYNFDKSSMTYWTRSTTPEYTESVTIIYFMGGGKSVSLHMEWNRRKNTLRIRTNDGEWVMIC